MQIDRRPNRGPYVAALVCLLLLCLSIPLYWRSKAEHAEPREGNSSWADYERRTLTLGRDYFPQRRDTYPNGTLLGGAQVDTLDELLFQLANRPHNLEQNQPDLFNELIGTPGTSFDAEAAGGIVWQYVASMLHTTGQEIARLEPIARLQSLIAPQREVERPSLSRADPLPTFSLMLTNPRERLAMLPRSGVLAPEPAVDAIAAPWCTPTVLMERLAVLAEHPYSNAWARSAIAELESLTREERPNPAMVAVQLGTLDTLAGQALALVDSTDDDCLRAELLRAHWGLRRRLECWSLMRDIAVASAADNRFAAREATDGDVDAFAGQGTADANLRALSGDLEVTRPRGRPPGTRDFAAAAALGPVAAAASRGARQRDRTELSQRERAAGDFRRAAATVRAEAAVGDERGSRPHRGDAGPRSLHHQLGESAAARAGCPAVACQSGVGRHGRLRYAGRRRAGEGSHLGLDEFHGTEVDSRRSGWASRWGPARPTAENSSQLVGIRSNVDWMPLVNDMVRTRAIEEYYKKRPRAKAEVECKVASRVEQQLDERAGDAVSRVQNQMRKSVTEPLANAGRGAHADRALDDGRAGDRPVARGG